MKKENQRDNIFKAITKLTKPRVKTFDEYFQECIRNKAVSADTPTYLKKALERALKEYQQGITEEKSALEDFTEKYTIDGEPGVMPIQYFKDKAPQIKDFFRSHRNIKVRFVLVCLMEKQQIDERKKTIITQDKAYFQ